MPKNGQKFLKREAKFLSFLCYYLTNVRAQKTFGLIFSNFCPIFRHLPPCLWLYLKKFLAKHFKIIKYQRNNSNTESNSLILVVEDFFSLGHCSGAL